jgi:hypothetical protein
VRNFVAQTKLSAPHTQKTHIIVQQQLDENYFVAWQSVRSLLGKPTTNSFKDFNYFPSQVSKHKSNFICGKKQMKHQVPAESPSRLNLFGAEDFQLVS